MALWTGVFGVGSWLFQSLSDSTAGRSLEHTRVAVDSDGRIVSAVDVSMRDLGGIDGKPLKVGGIGSVATLDDARRQGHSGRLLEDAIALMERERCAWSFLFTGTHHHYERYGWVRMPLRGRNANLKNVLPKAGGYQIEPLPGDGEWPLAEMAGIFSVFNEGRPLTHVRSQACWEIATLVRLQQPERRTWGASSDSSLVAYITATFNNDEMTIDEACSLPDHSGALGDLFIAAGEEAANASLQRVSFLLPQEEALDAAIAAISDGVEPFERGHTMARLMNGGLSVDDLKALFSHPTCHHYELDNF